MPPCFGIARRRGWVLGVVRDADPLSDVFEFFFHDDNRLYDHRIELGAGGVGDHLLGAAVWDGILVRTLAGQRIVDVGERDDAGGHGDVLALEPEGVARAVPPLVVAEADLTGGDAERVVASPPYGHTEAVSGGEKQVAYKRSKEIKRLMVKIPSGVKSGTKIRLKGMGLVGDKKSGDLYLYIKVNG